MPDEHVSILQSLGVAVLALAAVVWVLGLVDVVRRGRSGAGLWLTCRTLWFTGRTPLRAFPHQRQAPPLRESVDLTSAERDAFAGLVRQLSGGR